MTTTSLLQTALQNLHISQQLRDQSAGGYAPKAASVSSRGEPVSPGSSGTHTPPSGDEAIFEGGYEEEGEDENEMVRVGKGTAPGTPVPGQRGLVLGQGGRGRGGKVREKDPLRTLPTHLAVRIFLQLDVKALARCDRVCKRWHKSSTLNYVWFLQNRALVLPRLSDLPGATGKLRKTGDDTPDFFDPYDKSPRIASLPLPPIPSNTAPQWSKAESKKIWKSTFQETLKRSDPNAEPLVDPLRVDIESLQSSGTTTPNGGRHGYAGLGSGNAAKWASDPGAGMTATERKVAAREGYKALGGRKSRMKRKMGGEMGGRDKGGGVGDDGRFDAPF